MNIFFLDFNPQKAAVAQCDKHVVKMCLESAQLLSTCHYRTKSKFTTSLYKPTHINHPCSKWLLESKENYIWLFQHFIALCDEYGGRYFKSHKCENLLKDLQNIPELPNIKMTKPALAMPNDFKRNCPVDSYREYYKYKSTIMRMTWTYADKPNFM